MAPALDPATIGAFQNYLGVPATQTWDAVTNAAYNNFLNAFGFAPTYGMTGDINEWNTLVLNLQRYQQYGQDPNRFPTPNRIIPDGNGGTMSVPITDPRATAWMNQQPSTTGTAGIGTGANSASARAYISDLLGQWGLSGLTDWAMGQLGDGNLALVPSLIRQTDAYKARFAGNEARRSAGLNALSEAEYLNLENDYRQIMRSYGIPSGVFDTQSYLGDLIAKDLSPRELNDRLRIYQDAAYNAPTEVRDALQRFYGIDAGGLTAYFIDPERALPVLQQQYQAAGAASAADRAGFTQLSQATAERIAQLGGGAQSVDTFTNLRNAEQLYTPLAGGMFAETGRSLTAEEAAIGAFGGDAEAARAMRSRAEGRVAEFAGGGSFATTRTGVVGLGSSGG